MADSRLSNRITLLASLALAFASFSSAGPTLSSDDRPLRVAHVNANFTAGSGGITLREAAAVDPERYRATVLAPVDGTLFERAERAGLEVVRLRQMSGGR